jgi:hypothetical protein
LDELPNLANQTITGKDRAGGNNAIEDEDDDEDEDDCEKSSLPSWLLALVTDCSGLDLESQPPQEPLSPARPDEKNR